MQELLHLSTEGACSTRQRRRQAADETEGRSGSFCSVMLAWVITRTARIKSQIARKPTFAACPPKSAQIRLRTPSTAAPAAAAPGCRAAPAPYKVRLQHPPQNCASEPPASPPPQGEVQVQRQCLGAGLRMGEDLIHHPQSPQDP